MALTSTQLSDFRADIGDETSPYAFSDAELNRLYARTDDNYNEAVLLAIQQLLTNAAKFYKYVAGFTRQEQDKVFDNLLKLYNLKAGENRAANQVMMRGIEFIPDYSEAGPDA